MKNKNIRISRYFFSLVALTALVACSSGDPIDSRAALMASCETSQGIGWLKREYGDSYCDCWADQAKEVLSSENYQTLVKAAQAETKAADKADREKIIRQHTEIYSTVSDAAKRCAKAS
jgi:hypothetical protein